MDTATIPTWQRPEPVEEHRTNIVKVRLTDSELSLIKEKNPHASLSRFMREATLNAARPTEQTPQPKQKYSRLLYLLMVAPKPYQIHRQNLH